MNVLLLEDELPAAEKLQKALHLAGANLAVQAVLGSVKEATTWLQTHPAPDLIFMDIELSDGLSFALFDRVPVPCPVIFTTAYDEYWQEAFEHNGIDYLLKPVKEEKLAAALRKYDSLKQHFAANLQKLSSLAVQPQNDGYRKRFLVKRGTDFVSVKAEDIAYFYAAHKLVCLVTAEGQKFLLDQSLSDVEGQTDPALFHRVNRKYLVNLNAIKRIRSLPKSKLMVDVLPTVEEEIIVSQESAAGFKEWLGGNPQTSPLKPPTP